MSENTGSVPQDQGLLLNSQQTTVTLVAAGVKIATPSTGSRWKVYSFKIKLVTSGTAGSRTILVYLTDGAVAPVGGTEGTNVITEFVNNGTTPGTGRTVITGTTEFYEASCFKNADASITVFKAMAEPVRLLSGWSIIIQDTAQIDTSGDKVSVSLLAEEWLEPS